MPSEQSHRIALLQGTLDLILLRALSTMGPLHSYELAARLSQMADASLELNQGTLYPALIRLEQRGWVQSTWGTTGNNREAKYYDITRTGRKALEGEAARWRRLVAFVDKLLANHG